MSEPQALLETVLNPRSPGIWNRRGRSLFPTLGGWSQEFTGSERLERGLGSSTEGSQDAFGIGGASRYRG